MAFRLLDYAIRSPKFMQVYDMDIFELIYFELTMLLGIYRIEVRFPKMIPTTKEVGERQKAW